MCFPELPVSLFGEESQTTSVFFIGMNLVTESVRSQLMGADNS